MIFPSYDERLNLARERIGAATTPAERAARTTGQPPTVPSMMIAGRAFTVAPGTQQGYIGADGSGPTLDQQNTFLERSMSTPAVDPAQAAARMAPPPEGMMPNAAATNFGRLATARTDVPAFVPAAPTAMGSSATMLPTGNIGAKMAMLRAAFPGATRSELGSMGEMAWNRPGAFNASVAGTRLDPNQATERSQQAAASLAQTRASTMATLASPALDPYQRDLAIQRQEVDLSRDRQGMSLSAAEAARRAAGDTATQDFFSETDNAAIAAAARAGAPAQTLFEMHQVATQRADEARKAAAGAATPQEAALAVPPGAAAQLSQTANGRWISQFQMPGAAPELPKTEIGKLAQEKARAMRDGDTELVAYINARMKMITTPRPMGKYDQAVADAEEDKRNAAAKSAPATAAAGKAATAAKPTAPISTPSPAHITHLRQNPTLAAQFDAKFGPGAAKRALGQ